MDSLKNLKTLVKCGDLRTDNNVFRLHYKFTVMLLLVFSILLSSKQYFGDPITCDVDTRKEIVDVFCWVSGTFIVVDNNDEFSQSEGLEGLGVHYGKETYNLLYYQWVCVLILLQALLFYVPRFLWKCWEGNRLKLLLNDLCTPLVSEKWTEVYKEKMKNYILSQERHDLYAYRFAFCEFLNLCNLICQTLLMDWYLEGKFTLYGYEVATKPWPLAFNAVFPKKTKCIYTRYGPSGGNERWDALCVLPLNVLNEKFFLILWYWIIFMFAVTIVALIYRCLVMSWTDFRTYLLMAQVRSLSKNKTEAIVERLTHGQFFLMYSIGKNVNPIIYKEVLLSIYEHLPVKTKRDDFRL